MDKFNIFKLKEDSKNLLSLFLEEDAKDTDIAESIKDINSKGEAGVAIFSNIIEEAEGHLTALKEKKKDVVNAMKTWENIIMRAKQALVDITYILGRKNVTVGGLSVTRCDGQPSLDVIDESLIPDKYKSVDITISKSDLPFVLALLPEDKIKVSDPKVNVSMIKDEYKKNSDEIKERAEKLKKDPSLNLPEIAEIGIAGTQIIRNPYPLIKG